MRSAGRQDSRQVGIHKIHNYATYGIDNILYHNIMGQPGASQREMRQEGIRCDSGTVPQRYVETTAVMKHWKHAYPGSDGQ